MTVTHLQQQRHGAAQLVQLVALAVEDCDVHGLTAANGRVYRLDRDWVNCNAVEL